MAKAKLAADMGIGSRRSHRIFIHGTNAVNKGLIVLFSAFLLFFGLFFVASPLLEEDVYIFSHNISQY